MSRFGMAAVAAIAVTAGAAFGEDVTLSVDKVQQRYPWNGMVDIDYTVTCPEGAAPLDAANDILRFELIDESVQPPKTNAVNTLSECPVPVAAGTHRIAWNAHADGVTCVSKDVKMRLSVTHYAERYMIVDLTKTDADGKYAVTYCDGQPADGFSQPEYKTDKLVLRLIPPGSFIAGSPTSERNHQNTEVQHKVTITKPFYLGIFEITQAQYRHVMGSAIPKTGNEGDERPMDNLSYNDLRGAANTTTHLYDWPWNSGVDTNGTIIGRMCLRTGLRFDLPTEAQWEYACRAGTTTPYNRGNPTPDKTSMIKELKDLGRFKENTDDKRGDSSYTTHTKVGSYEPNGWGLYDMHGNVKELCLDRFRGAVETLEQRVDPVGSYDDQYRAYRGGSHSDNEEACRAARRQCIVPHSNDFGARLFCELPSERGE